MPIHPGFIWGLLGVLLIASEMLIPGFVIFFFGSGAIVTAILSVIIPGIAARFGLQAIIWSASSILSLIILRRRFSKIFKGTVLNSQRDESVGKTALVTEKITPESPGRVRYQGTTWTAVSYTETFEPGEKVEIIKEDGLTLVVTQPFIESDTT